MTLEELRPAGGRGVSGSTAKSVTLTSDRIVAAFRRAQVASPFDAPTSTEARRHEFWTLINGRIGEPPFPAETDTLYDKLCAAAQVRL